MPSASERKALLEAQRAERLCLEEGELWEIEEQERREEEERQREEARRAEEAQRAVEEEEERWWRETEHDDWMERVRRATEQSVREVEEEEEAGRAGASNEAAAAGTGACWPCTSRKIGCTRPG